MASLLSPPSPFDPTKEWQDWLAELKTRWPQDDPAVQMAVREAEAELARPRRRRETKD
jgi:hypothetical protein